jgi:hypothetical protein
MYNSGNSSKNVTGASVVDGTLENADYTDNAISGDKIDGGIISNFQSTGIDDNATSTAITIDSSENVQLSTGNKRLYATSNAGNKASLVVFNQTAATNSMFIGGGTSLGEPATDISFYTGSAGATGAGTTRISVTDNGLTFNGDTAAANALDDYEEGTWTPNVGGDATYTAQSGRYTIVGRKVTASWDMTINVFGTGSVNVISGLPVASGDSMGGGGSITYVSGLAAAVVDFSPTVSGSGVRVRSFTAAKTVSGNNTIFGDSARIAGTVTYTV